MKKIFGLVVVLIYLMVGCNTRAKQTTVVESDSTKIANRRLARERAADSVKFITDSLDVLIEKTGNTIDSLMLVRRNSKSKKLDSLISLENEKYKSYLYKREESMILD